MNSKSNLTNRTFSGILLLLSSGGIQVVLKIAVLAVLTRLINPEEFGLAGIAVVIIEFSKLFSHMGVGPFIVQRKELEARHLQAGFSFSIFMGIIFASLLILSAPLLEDFFLMEGLTPLLRVIAIIFLFDSFTVTGMALLQRNMRFKAIAMVEIMSYFIGYGTIGILLAYLGFGVWALVIASISQAIIHSVLVMSVQPFSKRTGFDRNAIREFFYYGGGITIAKVANFLANHIDGLVVGRMLGAGPLGIYGRAHQFMVMPSSLFGNALDRAMFPAMATVQDDNSKLAKAFLISTSLIALIAIPISILFIFLAPEIVLILLGNQWTEVILPFQILAGSLLFRMSYKMSDSLARSTMAVYKRAWRQIIYAAAVFIGAYIGHFQGLPGVAIGVALSFVLNFCMMSHLSMQLTRIKMIDLLKAHWHGLIIGTFTGVFTYSLVSIIRQLNKSHIVTLTGTVCGVGLLLFITIFFYPKLFIRNDHKELINKLVLNRFRKQINQAA